MHNARKRDQKAYAVSGRNTLQHAPVYRRLRPKHAESEGLLALAEDERPEATLLMGVSWYASQRHTRSIIRGWHIMIYVGGESVGGWLNRWRNAE